MDGAEIHAQLIENILAGTRLKRPPATSWLELLAFLLMAITLIILLPRKGPGYGVMIFLAGTLADGQSCRFSQATRL
jgi:CHASE2 domain-containing sensor protein